ncbi:transglutaminase-like domain-containing protein [Mucilaginibacter celer]|uniref:Transglutaminase domain-containing protein n=1 Tax=Mucilaginibacter celer TaxID=2305508 RepID=A0A494VLZ5_9SPHI|nr:transglutaminase-like domain-containing protein [Mucilaginibacter celer]AYL94641.1 transglutaminase domain-containing protein [Mucilaginibacter celer]
MTIKLLITYTLCMFFAGNVNAIEADSAVTITSLKNEYRFNWNSKSNRVEIKQKLNSIYTSNAYQVNYTVTEFYNNNITIDDISCKVDGHTPRNFKPLYTYYGSDDIFYSDERICYFPLELAKKGSNGNVTFEETLTDPRYFTSIYFAEAEQIQQGEVSIEVPRWMKLDIKELNFNGFNIKKSTVYKSGDDADIITYTFSNIPAMKKEPNSPGPTYIYPHLLIMCKSAAAGGKQFTYFNTLADQYAWYRELVKDVAGDQAVISAKSRELTAGLTNDMDKIKAIFYYVQDNIRYIAFEDGMAGFKPEKADEVLRKKYGDCKGMANLTKALLTAAGYDARLCWLGTKHIAYDYQTPSMAVDNHMICGLNYKGKTYYLDATETYLGFNEYAERIQGRQVLMEDGDKYILAKIPYALPVQNLSSEISKLSIKGTTLTGKVSNLWKGEDKEGVLAGINSVKHEKVDEATKRYLAAGSADYTITNLVLSSTANPDKDLTAAYDVERKNGISAFGKEYYIDMDNRKELSDAAIAVDKRKNDFWFPGKQHIVTETELTLPPNYKASGIPPELNISKPGYEFHISYVSSPGKLTYKKTLLIKNTLLTKANFAQWNQDIEQLNKAYNENLVIKPVSQ